MASAAASGVLAGVGVASQGVRFRGLWRYRSLKTGKTRVSSMASIERHRQVQAIAKEALAALGGTIGVEDTERSIAARVAGLLAERGIVETWYYDSPSFDGGQAQVVGGAGRYPLASRVSSRGGSPWKSSLASDFAIRACDLHRIAGGPAIHGHYSTLKERQSWRRLPIAVRLS